MIERCKICGLSLMTAIECPARGAICQKHCVPCEFFDPLLWLCSYRWRKLDEEEAERAKRAQTEREKQEKAPVPSEVKLFMQELEMQIAERKEREKSKKREP